MPKTTDEKKKRTSFALDPETLRLLPLIAAKLDRSQANTVETAVKELAKKHKIK